MRLIVLALLAACIIFPTASPAAVSVPARISLTDGEVLFRTPDSSEWLPAAVNTPLDDGDAIWVAAGGKSEIQLADGSVIRLNSDSQLDLIAVVESYTHLHLANGSLYLRTSPKSVSNSLQIDADDTTVLPEARTRLRIDMLPHDQEDVTIVRGSAYVEGNGSRTRVRAGEHLALEDGHNELLPLNPPDNWDRWNTQRDLEQSRSAKTDSPLPAELNAYSGELESHGHWVRTPEYGMAWRPEILNAPEWAPYQSGRWIWKGDDYVWIAYESWGWAPYHYGRWAVIGSFGWCWVPPVRGDVFWGPGYVGWYRDSTRIGWTPLAPGETFYGRRHYGQHSVNVINTPVNTAAIRYKNRDARGGLSILLQSDFVKGRVRFQQPGSNNSFSVSVVTGSPRIQPERETRMPVIKQLPPRVAPPASHYRDVHELRDRFPRVQATPRTISPASEGRPVAPPAAQQTPRRPDEQLRQQHSAPIALEQRRTPHADGTVSKSPRQTGELSGREVKGKDAKPRKQWRVTTTEHSSDKDPKEKDNREQRGRRP
jgi:hypothetical protein